MVVGLKNKIKKIRSPSIWFRTPKPVRIRQSGRTGIGGVTWYHDLLVYCTAFNSVATSKWCLDITSFSSLICGCLTWSFCRDPLVLPSISLLLLQEFCGRDLDMNLHCCQGVTTSGPLILVHLFCCNLLRPVVSVLLNHFLLILLQYPLSLEFPAA